MKTLKEPPVDRAIVRRLLATKPAALLDAMTVRQHMNPREPLGTAVFAATADLGVCPVAVERALRWLGLDSSASVGRLRRTELTQLATAIHRFWRQAALQPTPAPQPA